MRIKLKRLAFAVGALVAAEISWGGVSVRDEPIVMPTYEIAPADKNPFFFTGRTYQGAAGHVYPYPMYDVLTDTKTDRAYKAVSLENEYTSLCVSPELGGRILSATDKETSYDFFYRQHVVKPALIGMIGAWMSGGVEWNIPHHHRASTQLPVDYRVEKNSDGSATVWIGETELRHRLKWIIGLTVRPGRSYVEATVRIFNNTPFLQSMLYWANVSVHCNDNYKVIFPPRTQFGTQHAKNEFIEWPVGKSRYGDMDCNGMDMTMWKNYPKACSIFAWNFDDDFLAGYDFGADAGTVHVANHHVVNGKKFFLWGNCDSARMWRNMLTDYDGDYLELMVGAFSDNQPDYSWINPGEMREFKQYWYPVTKIGGVKNATVEAAVNLERRSPEKLFVGFNASAKFSGAKVRVLKNGALFFEETVDISPVKPYMRDINVIPSDKTEDFSVSLLDGNGVELVSYAELPLKREPKPETVVPPSDPKGYKTVEELYLAGLRIEQFHNATLNPEDYYAEALRRDPGDARTNTAMGLRTLKQHRYAEAEKYLKAAAGRLTRNYTNAKDVEPLYYLAVLQDRTGRTKEAKDNYWKSTWRAEFKAPAFFALAQIACREGKYREALELADKSLQYNSKNVKAMAMKALILRKLGENSAAEEVLDNALKIDSIDFFAASERAFLDDDPPFGDISRMGNPLQNALETACFYMGAGAFREAQDVLISYADAIGESGSLSPLVNYYIGYCKMRLSDAGAKDSFAAASAAPADYCFPFRAEEIDILNAALEANSSDAKAHYYLGNLLYFSDRKADGLAHWRKAVSIDDGLGIAWRNIGFALGRLGKLGEAISAYEHSIKVLPDNPRAYFELDKLYEAAGKPAKERLALLEKNSAAVAKRDDAIARQIELYIVDGQYSRALDILKKRHFRVWEGGGQIHDTFVDACLLGGLEKLKAKDFGGALELFRLGGTYPRNLEVGRPADGGSLPQSIFYEASVLDETGKKAEALALYKRVTEFSDRGDADILNFYKALSWSKLGRKAEADKCAAALEKGARGLIERDGRLDFFSKFGEQSLKAKRDSSNRLLLGLSALARGDSTTAKAEIQTALKLNPDNIWAKHFLSTIK